MAAKTSKDEGKFGQDIANDADNERAAGKTSGIASKALAMVAVGERTFRAKKQVTRPVLQQVDNVQYAVTIEGAIKQAEELKGKPKMGADNQPIKPPKIVDIINLETGQLMTLIVGAVLESELERSYPDQGYVGLSFALRSGLVAKKGDAMQKMRIYDIVEIEAD